MLAKLFDPWERLSEQTKWAYQSKDQYETWLAKVLKFRDKYHSWSHPDATAAERCYREYLLDQKLEFYVDQDCQLKCRECFTWTTIRAGINGGSCVAPIALCQAHESRDYVEKWLFKKDDKKT